VTWGWALLAPLALQATAMAFDELYFHRRRGLGAWERIGHPFDTLTVLVCMGWALFTRPDRRGVACYVGLALLSSLFITKDEWVHARSCSPGEHWLHAVLFVVHPVSLASIGLLWPALHAKADELPAWLVITAPVAPWLVGQFALTAAFCLYQIVYWNSSWVRHTSPTP
jgi:hypothetical protein